MPRKKKTPKAEPSIDFEAVSAEVPVHRRSEIPVIRLRRACRVCGCTDFDCSGCVARTGWPCFRLTSDLCSACGGAAPANDSHASRLMAA